MHSFSISTISKILYLLPISLISGSFFPDLIIIFSSIIFIFCSVLKKEYKYYKNLITNIFWIWCIYLIFTSLISSNPMMSLESSLFYFRFGFFVLSIWYIADHNKNFVKYFILSIAISFSIIIADGYYQFFTGNNFFGYFYDGIRLSSLFGEEQILGSYLSRILPIFFGLVFYQYYNSKKILTFAMLILVLSGILIYLSGERSAFFYLLLSLVIILLFIKEWRNYLTISAIIALFLIIAISITNSSTKERMIDKTFEEINVFSEGKMNAFSPAHQEFYNTSFKIISKNYIFGIGPKLFRYECKKFENLEGHRCGTHPHNSYIQLLTETGIFGFLAILCAFLFVNFIYLRQSYFMIFKKINYLENHTILLYLSILITLWPLVPTGNFFHNWLNVIYFLPMGFIIHMKK